MKIKKIMATLCICSLMLPVYGKSKKQNKKSDYNIRELALPSDVENISKKMGAIYYSPTVKGKVLIPVHFWGEIRNTGLHFIPMETKLIKGLSLAGGPSASADLEEVFVTTVRDGKQQKVEFDLSKGGGIDIENFKLEPNDTVFVSKDYFREDRTYYTSLTGVILTLLSSILLYRQVKD